MKIGQNFIAALFVASLLLATGPASAKVYKSVLPDGTVVYSDSPPTKDAKELKLPEIQTYTPTPVPSPTPSPATEEAEAEGYDNFEVASPGNDEAVRDNAGTVSISLSLNPGLKEGHQVEIFLDGTSVGSGGATSASLTNVDRGTHSVYAVVKNAEGEEVARTSVNTFHLKRVSAGN